ncbi:DNA repair protein complementing XP-G cells homolog [Megalops cyprinoides]|uniref:DNA repair protein complementing XP-G cells homolog n=1 Tax=Megalops cyprinoides TaxID=118141 RepID=UPI0018655057|nr:DNA repair protein complementing XP-G cells homolog [Megalops cyprinoides]
MGVQGLWKLLESTGKPINPETLEGKILAVDISIWLNQAVKGVRDRDGNSVQNAHLLTLFHRLCKLLFFRIRPVFVFDGDTPLLKRETVAKRRQRKEEMTRESKQTNEKLLKTLMKRQAIRAALGERSQEEFPSISSVRREEVDDMYVLPALEEKEENSSDEEEEKEWEQTEQRQYMFQEMMFENPNAMDIDSEEFAVLPAEMKHEILKDMKEFSKRRRTMFEKPPERSGDFSQYQLAGLLHRNKLNHRIEGVEKEMNQRSSGAVVEQYRGEEGEGHNVETQRLVSEDTSHYILIKGSKNSEKAVEKQPAVLPWASSTRAARKRPEPLWRPVSEDSPEEEPPSPPGRDDTAGAPPSPRTLQAIQAAMMDSGSDEDSEVRSWEPENLQVAGPPSPRTLLAIQRALTEDHTAPPQHAELPRNASPIGGCVIISSSEEEVEEATEKRNGAFSSTVQFDSMGLKERTGQGENEGQTEGEGLRQSEEQRESEGPRESAEQGQRAGRKESEGQRESAELTESVDRKQDGCLIPHTLEDAEFSDSSSSDVSLEKPLNQLNSIQREALNGGSNWEESHPAAAVHACPLSQQEVATKTGSTSEDAQQERPLRAVTPLPAQNSEESEQGVRQSVEEGESEDSESQESFIEVSEEEEEEEEEEEVEPDDQPLKMEEENWTEKAPEGVEGEEGEGGDPPSESSCYGSPSPNGEKQQDIQPPQEPPQEPSPAPAANDWAHIDMEELVQLESSLQSQESSLKAQKQQQERVAATVTGQMCLESQELLRLFGVPFLVAPMEAEAQCAVLDRSDQTHGTITDDSDIWLFGGRHVYKNFFSHSKYVEHYQYLDLQAQLGLDRSKLINLAYLLGSDYTEGIAGVGYVTGMEILNEFPGPGMEPLISFSEWWKEAQENKKLVANPNETKVKKKLRNIELHPGFPNPAVAQAYLQPAVDQSSATFTWGRPDLENIKDFCLSRFGWSGKKTEDVLQPVMKQLSVQQTQLRIDSFFRLEQQDRQAIRSQRLRRAVTCLKRKEQGEEEEDEEDSSPTKTKKGKTGEEEEKAKSEEPAKWAGGFLGSGDSTLSLGAVEGAGDWKEEAAPRVAPPKLSSLKAERSSSSGEDSDYDDKVAMVTARSVFQSKPQGRGRRGGRGKNKRKV